MASPGAVVTSESNIEGEDLLSAKVGDLVVELDQPIILAERIEELNSAI